jgi:transposase
MPAANAQTLQIQLDELSRNLHANGHMLLILDGAGWHKSHALRIPDNLTLLHLPPYAPELNPVELVWHEMRQRYLSNRVYANLQELDQALEKAWRRLSDDPQRLRQLTHFDWILQALDSHNHGRNEGPDTS